MNPSHKTVRFLVVLLAVLVTNLSAKRPPKQGKNTVNENVHVNSEWDEPSDLDNSLITLDIEHSIGTSGVFVRRGSVSLRGFRVSRTTIPFQQDSLSQTQLQTLKNAARSGAMYFLRAKAAFTESMTDRLEEPTDTEYIMTAISACSLYNARLSDWITISGDGEGNVIGLTITTPVHTMGLDCLDDVHLPHHFNTTVLLDNGAPCPIPDTQGFQQKVENEENKKRDGTDDRSFLQKYWMYLVIGLIVITMVSGIGGGGQ